MLTYGRVSKAVVGRPTCWLAFSFQALLTGCGTYVPHMEEFWEGTKPEAVVSAGGALEYKIKQKVYCGIVDAVIASREQDLLPDHWSVQLTLDLQVDETGALSPSVTFINPMPVYANLSAWAWAASSPHKERTKINLGATGIWIK